MKNAASVNEINAKAGQAIKSFFEGFEDAWMCSNYNRLENQLMSYIDEANSRNMTVSQSVKHDQWDDFSHVIRVITTDKGWSADFIAKLTSALYNI